MEQHYITVPISRDNPQDVFTVNTKYRVIRRVGSGAYGTVCSAFDQQHQRFCAIKKMHRVFEKELVTKRCIREMKLLQLFSNHPRIIQLFDMDIVYGLDEVYLIFGCMDASLHDVIRSQQPLDTVHAQWFIYQILSGLKYIHSANVVHRDLKPANILVNKDCNIRICDFGMARAFSQTNSMPYLTEYVTTRWYRAPEIMINSHNYSKAIDIWSAGCVFGEILGRKVLFQGRDHVDQLYKILGVLGLPNDISFWDPSEAVSAHIKNLCTTDGLPPPTEPVDFNAFFPSATPEAIELLKRLLHLDPAKRITAEEALKHPFVQPFSDSVEESLVPPYVDPQQYYIFEDVHNNSALKSMAIQEIEFFKHRMSQQELSESLLTNNTDGTITTAKRSHTAAVATTMRHCTSPTQNLNYLPSATMSLLEQNSPSKTQAEENTFSNDNQFVGEPEEIEEDENYSYLYGLVKDAPGVTLDVGRQLKEPNTGEEREFLERTLSGNW